MINYSTVMRSNPANKTAPKKAYASAQYSEVMDINKFAEHIASHGCVYKRADIVAILTMSVDCMRELMLAGQKIQLGDLGSFSVSINSIGAPTAKEFNPAIHIKKLNVNWTCGERFTTLLDSADFNLVATRLATRAIVKALKAGETTVDISKPTTTTPEGGNQPTNPGGGGGDENENPLG
ncbi:HU family DNA-binding protein [Bacteroides helcogenes]|uniref:DNA-binding protein n=1 Tax=Bacteroides helcogenes (strain ATCC 35417 / DSM 20613 / JCM 6297 / CCUG 15421 / P 36-108) TaxID=693979 RepID=E6SVW8_BACT6|nr:HU family DNA-binding protein [Bacteroides helcogenes]ADV44557.1 DNA-binding protein [Bacteroides helcogenes P 36-108]MDY5238964.1 HU family DNA-binding protein [Bacteroides helcogenes]